MPFPSAQAFRNPFPPSRPFPMPSPRTGTGTNVGSGRPAWGEPTGGWNTRPGRNVPPASGGKTTPVNPRNLPSGNSVSGNNLRPKNPRNDYPDRPVETWNLNPKYRNGRPFNPNKLPIDSPLNNDPLGRPVGEFGEWMGRNIGRWIIENWLEDPESSNTNFSVPAPPTSEPQGNTNAEVSRGVQTANEYRSNTEQNINLPYPMPVTITETSVTQVQLSDTYAPGSGNFSYTSFINPPRIIFSGDVSSVFIKVTQNLTEQGLLAYRFNITRELWVRQGNVERYITTTQTYKSTWFVSTIDGQTRYEPYTRGETIIITNLAFDGVPLRSPNQSPKVWRQPNNDTEQEEEDGMSCPPCRAAQALRALQRTVTVDTTAITIIPTGNALIGPTLQKPVRVFALPGTEDSIRQQFNLFDDLRKRLAKTFNQGRMAKVMAQLNRIMGVADFVLNVHNALMLSEDIVETAITPITSAVDTIIRVVDDTPFIGELYDLGETQPNTREFVGKLFDENMQRIFGVEGWADIKNKWASFNNIVRGAAMQIQAVRDINDSQKELAEMTASKMGKLHNKMQRAGLFFDDELWNENVKARQTWIQKFYRLEEIASDNPITNAAEYVNSWGNQVLDIREQKRDLQEQRTRYNEELQRDMGVLTNKKAQTATDSTGAPYARSDANPPETDE